MLDQAIQDFLNERKALWLKKKIKSNTNEDEERRLNKEANDLFSLEVWLPDAAKRAKQLSLVSHPAKFSHPSAKASSIIADQPRKADGFLRTGNVELELDVFGNAAAMDVYKFLMLNLADGKTILKHLEEDSELIKQQLAIKSQSYEELSDGLLAIKQSDSDSPKTSGSIKQVYFPVEDDYHLLSIMTNSSLMFRLKQRINQLRFSDDIKEAREAKKQNKLHATGYADITDLTAIGFGGTKPQNISVMNSQNGGVALLLSSAPPFLEKRKTNPPRDNFFGKFLYPKDYQTGFEKFHQALVKEINNRHTRNQVRWQAINLIHEVIDKSWDVRYLPAGWSDSERYKGLPKAQKYWLDQQYKEERQSDDAWLDKIKKELSRWFLNTYEKVLEGQALRLSDYEFIELKQWLDDCEGGLK